MTQVITLENFVPIARYDGNPWTEARIEEGDAIDGTFTVIDTIAISPVDTDPEHPEPRSFTTELASDTADLWYRIVFADATGDETSPTIAIQNVAQREPYATVEELARILKIRTPTDEQTNAMVRVLLTAAGEIDAEIDRTADDPIAGWQLELAAEVNLERAVEHWRQQESPFGLIGLGGEVGTGMFAGRDSWTRHAMKLSPLKSQWGLA